ncbi:calcium-binding protein [Siccirubricoccus deserti]|uniref:Calcium-binding protein n=1 Tax=Siccirubricoccus deserti TaxID=2013562 RepID=A0A9X0R0J7_9PROT|nr:calcium-binding protein [Siccirubricoccus deserti]MBC4017496.1 calcium-binding protein [Siccirubricoccus deserti]
MGDFASIIGGGHTDGGIASDHDAVYHIGGTGVILDRGGTTGEAYVDATGSISTYVQAGSGADTILGGTGNDSFKGGAGEDSISSGSGADSVEAGSGGDTVDGGMGDDKVVGGDGDDFLLGGEGNDTLFGGDGLDTLIGGLGNDLLIGGSGADLFVFDVNGFGNDTISGFQAGDEVRIVAGVEGINSEADLAGKVSVVGNSVKIDLGGGSTITISGISGGTTAQDLVNDISSWLKVGSLPTT